jgi:hypothetical protein
MPSSDRVDKGRQIPDFEAKAYQLLVSRRYSTLGRWLGILPAGLLFSLFTTVNLSYLSVLPHNGRCGIARLVIGWLFPSCKELAEPVKSPRGANVPRDHP